MITVIKVWDVVNEVYLLNMDEELLIYKDEDEAIAEFRQEGYKEEWIQTAIEFHQHVILD